MSIEPLFKINNEVGIPIITAARPNRKILGRIGLTGERASRNPGDVFPYHVDRAQPDEELEGEIAN
jgi:hypothetical protein